MEATKQATTASEVLDAESVQAINRFFRASNLKAVRETNIGKALAKRDAAA